MIVLAMLALGACSGSDQGDRAEPVDGPLSILLVNDDGWDAPGITAMYDALRAAGHDVTLVAPLENQSGKSMSTSTAALSVTRPVGSEPKYAVDGTPVDALNIGLRGVLKSDPPDLVISGINGGANVAENTNYSGTVGAAAAASEQGFPAVAVSADVGGPKGVGDNADAARIVVRLVNALARRGFEGLGPEGFINLNVPFETEARDAPRGLKVVPLADAAPRTVQYVESSPELWTPTFSYAGRVGPASADASQLADGWATMTFLPVARAADADGQRLLELLAGQLD